MDVKRPEPGSTVLAGWQAGNRFASLALRNSVGTSSLAGLVLIVVGLAMSWFAVYSIGGAQHVVPHFFYVPILFAAVRFGPLAALITALLAGVIAGPMTLLDVATQAPQDTQRWLTRAAFFTTIGVGMAALVRPSLPRIMDEVHRLRSARALREAIASGELFVRYQPVVSMSSGGLYGVEALVRWDHPEHGELAPDAFLDDAERSGAIRDLDIFVFEQACRQAARWSALAEEHGTRPPSVAVNMSRANLEAPELIRGIRDTLKRTGADESQLCIEVTESLLVDDFDVSAARLAGLRTLGVSIAIDDFGTGYSSLSALHRFPVDVLKVDRSFVRAMGREPQADNLVGAIVLLARSLDVMPIAEGVETVRQRDTLVDRGYDIVQGFYYARPLHPEQIDRLVTTPAPFEVAPITLAPQGDPRVRRGSSDPNGS